VKATLFGWLLLALIVVLNQFAVTAARRSGRMRLAFVLFFGVPSFVGFALAQMGVRLLGGDA
jgi:hypothetical protein